MANNQQYPGLQPPPPPSVVYVDPPRSLAPPMRFQFCPTTQALQPQQSRQTSSQNFQLVGGDGAMMGHLFPSQPHPLQFMPSVHQPLSVGPPMLNAQLIGPITSKASLAPPSVQAPNNSMPGLGGPRAPLSSFHPFASSNITPMIAPINALAERRPSTEIHAPGVHAGAQRVASVSQTPALASPMQHLCEQPSVVAFVSPKPYEKTPTDWIEHTSSDGRRRTSQSTWEKPFELMSPMERADATTDWKEYTSPDGRKYYYNKITRQSKWSLPKELKIARENLGQASVLQNQTESMSAAKMPSPVIVSNPAQVVPSNPDSLTPSTSFVKDEPVLASQQAVSAPKSSPVESVDAVQKVAVTVENANSSSAMTETTSVTWVDMALDVKASEDAPVENEKQGSDGTGPEKYQKTVVEGENIGSPLKEKPVDQDPVLYTSKMEAKDAFKSLLESANVGPGWTWEQAMRVIINDRRYGALRTLGERKQAFSEFLVQKKKGEAEERRMKQKRAWEEFKMMLEECKELTSSTRWSKALTMFEDDERFKALEREKDCRDIFEDYIDEMKEKERVKAQVEYKQSITDYRKFLESCNFIKANSQWRKVQDRIEADERCLRLEKIDRIEIFQKYLQDLEREEEEQRKIQKEEIKRAERKNRDNFRKLMDEHIVAGILTPKTSWHDYVTKIRDLPAYLAISSNSSGASTKDLFADVVEDLQKQYREDKSRVKDALKQKKITLSPASTLDELKISISEDISFPPISDINLKLVFDDMLKRAKEKKGKDDRKRKRFAEDLVSMFRSFKDITALSSWEDCKHIVERSKECSSIGDESFRKQVFEEYVSSMKEQANETEWEEEETVKERMDRRKARDRREKGRVRERDIEGRPKKAEVGNDNSDAIEVHEHRRSGKDTDSRHGRQWSNMKENEGEHRKGAHKHGGSHKKSRQQWGLTPDAEEESRGNRQREKEDEKGIQGHGDEEELEDGECCPY